jgi:hypothetical protein
MLFVRAANENAATRASPTKILWVELRQIHSYCIFPSASFVVNRCVHRSTDSSVGPVEEDRRNLFSPRHSLINESRITQARPLIAAPKVTGFRAEPGGNVGNSVPPRRQYLYRGEEAEYTVW